MSSSSMPDEYRAVPREQEVEEAPRFVEDHFSDELPTSDELPPVEVYETEEYKSAFNAEAFRNAALETFDEEHSIPVISATVLMSKQAVNVYERRETEQAATSAQEIKLDGSNKVSFPDYPYVFEALGEKILVSIDVFKSGYECKTCHGKKQLEIMCDCEKAGRPGYKYDHDAIAEAVQTLGENIATSRAAMLCPTCEGHWQEAHRTITCTDCKGIGATLVLPETSKNLPSTGVIVSMGKKAKELCSEYSVGDRILFGAYAGTMIPTKSGLMFKYLDWTQAVLRIEGADDMAAFDFILNTD